MLLLVAFFVVMPRIDYTVTGELYDYGLRFSYEWANGMCGSSRDLQSSAAMLTTTLPFAASVFAQNALCF